MLADHKIDNERLTAYISTSQDREMNEYFEASICDDDKDEIIAEESGYDRDKLIEEVELKYPGIKIENA